MVLKLSENVTIPDHELEFSAIRASGPGGQHVNKVSSAVHLRFDSQRSSLPEFHKARLLARSDQRISREGVITIKSQNYRSQEKNRLEALDRLRSIIVAAIATAPARKPTRPGKNARKKRVDNKTRRGDLKRLRTKVRDD